MGAKRVVAPLAGVVVAAFGGGYAIAAAGHDQSRSLANLKITGPTGAQLSAPARSAGVGRTTSFVFGRRAVAEPGSLAYSVARCPAGTHVLSGGWNSADTSRDAVTISSSTAIKNLAGWLVGAVDTSSSSDAMGYIFQAVAVCAP